MEVIPEDLTNIESNVDVMEVMANICIEEQAHITICSNRKRNPNPDYDIVILPATYNEAMQCSDHTL
jgi:hypothetical protein